MTPVAARVAAGCSVVLGLGFGVPAVYGTWYFAQHDEVWQFLGFPTYGDGPFESVGIETSVPLLAGFAAVCAAEVTCGVLLARGRRAGYRLSWGLLPVEAVYWVGFALPFGPLLGVGRTVAAVAAARALRPQSERA